MMINKGDFVIEITPVGLGFGKDVTGKVSSISSILFYIFSHFFFAL